MIIFPAIDLKDGKCVRLYKGDFNKTTIFNSFPFNQALEFQKKRLHSSPFSRFRWRTKRKVKK